MLLSKRDLMDVELDVILQADVFEMTDINVVEDTRVVEKMAYPNYAALKERGHALSEMGDLLGEYSRLELSEKENTGDEIATSTVPELPQP